MRRSARRSRAGVRERPIQCRVVSALAAAEEVIRTIVATSATMPRPPQRIFRLAAVALLPGRPSEETEREDTERPRLRSRGVEGEGSRPSRGADRHAKSSLNTLPRRPRRGPLVTSPVGRTLLRGWSSYKRLGARPSDGLLGASGDDPARSSTTVSQSLPWRKIKRVEVDAPARLGPVLVRPSEEVLPVRQLDLAVLAREDHPWAIRVVLRDRETVLAHEQMFASGSSAATRLAARRERS